MRLGRWHKVYSRKKYGANIIQLSNGEWRFNTKQFIEVDSKGNVKEDFANITFEGIGKLKRILSSVCQRNVTGKLLFIYKSSV